MKRFVYSIVLVVYAINSAWCNRPIIKTDRSEILQSYGKDIVVEAGKPFTLRCEAPTHVNWTSYPLYESDENPNPELNISGWKTNINTYVTNLRVEKSHYLDTGYYYCSTDYAKNIDDDTNVASIYVYVKDEEVILIGADAVLETVVQHSTHIIPCRPTSPDIAVSLMVNGERIDGRVPEYGDTLSVSFNPTIGFTLKNINLKDSNLYICVAERDDGHEQTEHVSIHVLQYTEEVPVPTINGSSVHLNGVEGEKIVLECSVIMSDDIKFAMSWAIPDTSALMSGRIIDHNTTSTGVMPGSPTQMKTGVKLLTIKNATINDKGLYQCNVTDHNQKTSSVEKYLHITGSDEKYINLTKEVDLIEVQSGKFAQWVIKFAAHPAPILSWFSPEDKNLSVYIGRPYVRFEQITNGDEIILRITNLTLNDAGVYRLQAKNMHMEKTLNMTLIVEEGPSITLVQEQAYFDETKTYNLSCEVTGYPRPKIVWKFKPCPKPPNCKDPFSSIKHLVEEPVAKRKSRYRSTLLRKASLSGYISCSALNKFGSTNRTMTFWVSDVGLGGFEVKVTAPVGADSKNIVAQDNVTLQCGVSKYNYTAPLTWDFRLDKNSSAKPTFDTHHQETNFSFKSSLIINNITEDHSGSYICTANDASEKIQIVVKAQEWPTIESESMNDTDRLVKEGELIELTCNAKGLPKPTITWQKDDQDLAMSKDNITLYDLKDENTTLVIKYAAFIIEGKYTCLVRNRAGSAERSTLIKLGKPPLSPTTKLIIGAFVVLVLISFCVIGYLVNKIRKEKKLRKELKAIGLEQFDKGAMDSINPDLPIDDQAELLPYDRKWEFPREKLKLGKQLGAGAFGVVMKADAIGICEGEAVSMVAVKMVKRNADHTYIKALASELKIMVHLGKHLNVVNLLGACTKNLNKKELLVIVEYCRFGNLHNYLLRHRSDFIDQVDPVTGIIDPNFGADIIARHDSMVMKSSRSDSESSGCSPTNSGTLNSEAALISMAPMGGEEGCMLSNNSIQPEWRSNYRGDYKGHVRPICTRDVICWAFQVARGMEYLAGRKVLHGDLAARNILLADDNVVKICDFGLAKSMYKTDNYKKKGDGPLPIKWMAVESISDRVFSTQSDVWSYGIVLWEFFSLAKTPYPGMEADEKLYQKLIGGYRMDKPDFATNAIYEVMQNCWLAKPVDRPTFEDLTQTLGSMLEDSVKSHYMDLNDPYMNMNDINWKAGQQSDYLAMMTAPTYDNMVAPGAEGGEEDLHQYVNGGIPTLPSSPAADQGEASGYLCMSPTQKEASIFSPRATETNDLFSFSPKTRQSQGEAANSFEKSQLLSNDNNYQIPIKSPTAVNNLNKDPTNANLPSWELNPNLMASFSNPSYQMLSAAIAPTTDNYVNMPQHKQTGIDDIETSPFNNYVPMAKSSDGAFNQNMTLFSKTKDGEGFVHFPNHGHNLANASNVFQSEKGENPYVN